MKKRRPNPIRIIINGNKYRLGGWMFTHSESVKFQEWFTRLVDYNDDQEQIKMDKQICKAANETDGE